MRLHPVGFIPGRKGKLYERKEKDLTNFFRPNIIMLGIRGKKYVFPQLFEISLFTPKQPQVFNTKLGIVGGGKENSPQLSKGPIDDKIELD